MVFKPGQSGNPAGRPKKTNMAALRAREYTDKAIDTLIALLDDPKPEIRLRATEAMINRGWGMPKETHEHTGEDGGAIVQQHRGLPALMDAITASIDRRRAKNAVPEAGEDGPVLPAGVPPKSP